MDRREWLVANGLGGFASATVAMTLTRRYHGLLIAAEGDTRTLVLSRVQESLLLEDDELELSGDGFRLELGLPVWTARAGALLVQRRVFMDRGANTVHVRYRLLEGAADAVLRLRPWLQVRALDDEVDTTVQPPPLLRAASGACSLDIGGRVLTLQAWDPSGVFREESRTATQHYPLEAERGYASDGALWSPGCFEVALREAGEAAFYASLHTAAAPPMQPDVESNERRRRTELLQAAADVAPELALAADQFLVARRTEDSRLALTADGVIAGYHWFGRWGRDTMISLEGLTLWTGRTQEAAAILRETVRHVRRGLIPNFFLEHADALYHTADATLWLFHALHRHQQMTQDASLIQELLPVLRDIVARHLAGTDFNIRVDPHDGLLTQGVPDLPLTWMDAKVGDWVVTPRRGKAVELQALWYNALRLSAGWENRWGDADRAAELTQRAGHMRDSFNRRFWNDRDAQLFDVVDGDDGDDASCRPNQLLSFSLEHPVLDAPRRDAVLAAVDAQLVTPVGLRSLSPRDPRYQPRYDGDRRSRDAAYHQGTVWPWLVGPYADACRRARGDDSSARRIALELLSRKDRACAGQIAEIHDAQPPYAPRGCVAQAWSVAEVIRCLTGRAPAPQP